MTDYSQSGEQAVILAQFAEDTHSNARFLEIGAWDPKIFSNTRALYETGWTGIMVEPSPGPVGKLLDEYGSDDRVQIIAAAVALETGLLSIEVSDDGISSSVAENVEKWRAAKDENVKFRGRLHVPAITLEQISFQFGGFDFWSIDTEGTSVDIFLRALALGYRPDCICVEHDGRTIEAIGAALTAGYTVKLLNPNNLIVGR